MGGALVAFFSLGDGGGVSVGSFSFSLSMSPSLAEQTSALCRQSGAHVKYLEPSKLESKINLDILSVCFFTFIKQLRPSGILTS